MDEVLRTPTNADRTPVSGAAVKTLAAISSVLRMEPLPRHRIMAYVGRTPT